MTIDSLRIQPQFSNYHRALAKLRHQAPLIAEDLPKDFHLSPETIRPSCIAWFVERMCNVGADFGSLLATIAVRGPNLEEATQSAVSPAGDKDKHREVKTTRALLAGVMAHAGWERRQRDTMWLQRDLGGDLRIGKGVLKTRAGGMGLQVRQQDAREVTIPWTSASALRLESLAMQPGALFHLVLSPIWMEVPPQTQTSSH